MAFFESDGSCECAALTPKVVPFFGRVPSGFEASCALELLPIMRIRGASVMGGHLWVTSAGSLRIEALELLGFCSTFANPWRKRNGWPPFSGSAGPLRIEALELRFCALPL